MAEVLPRLRRDLDIMPSPLPERPGLLLRDPFRYADVTMIIPPPLAPCLALFDGERTDLDLREALVRITGDLCVSSLVAQLTQQLSEAGLFENESYRRLRNEKELAFARAERRPPAHAGSAYPENPESLRRLIGSFLDDGYGAASPPDESVRALVAPHVSLEGGRRSYADAYRMLKPHHRNRVFVILGASHYGEPNRFGLTLKPFLTPLGETSVAAEIVRKLAEDGGPAARMEDYCHAIEHSIELQVVFLQHCVDARIRVVPILCGPFLDGRENGDPDDVPDVRRFLEVLAGIAEREGERLFWVIGVDMSHIGRRYGDDFSASSGEGVMKRVALEDRARIDRLIDCDAGGFWAHVREERIALHWCGTSSLYAFLKAGVVRQGKLLRYEQWNIDDASVVSFGALTFW